ncbi:MAG: WhiB family transcriptional regulator [Acidimicrobiales bacterium]
MFTGSADQQPSIQESNAGVAIAGRPTQPPPPRAATTHGAVDLAGFVDLDGFVDLAGLEASGPALFDDSWMAEAACKGRTSLFFGIAGERPERRVRRERTARGVCDGCPVVAPCRERARLGRENGFWGGESEEERAAAGFPPRSISRRSVQQASTVRAEAS